MRTSAGKRTGAEISADYRKGHLSAATLSTREDEDQQKVHPTLAIGEVRGHSLTLLTSQTIVVTRGLAWVDVQQKLTLNSMGSLPRCCCFDWQSV